MYRQWDSEECCIFASFTNIYKSIYIHWWDTGTQLQWHVTNMAQKKAKKRKKLKRKKL